MIADPKAVVVTVAINSKEKTKRRRSIFNLESNKNTEHSFPMRRRSTCSRKLLHKQLPLTSVTNIVERQLKIENTKKKLVTVFHNVNISITA